MINMDIIKVPTWYYQQFDADYSLDVPGEGYGGWKKKDLELDTDKTAVIVVHAMYYGELEEAWGLFRAEENIPRAYDIGEKVLPGLLKTVRGAGMKVFHVAGSQDMAMKYEGYKRTLELAGEEQIFEQIGSDPVMDRLRKFKTEYSFPGAGNLVSCGKACSGADFDKNAMPLDGEEIVLDEKQLFALCKKHGINHLIYVGFNINWCILFSGAGMTHIYRYGIMCSTIRQAVTAVENKETARNEEAKELALWMTAVGFGFVYDIDDLTSALHVGNR
jgi:hypothetical protein